MVLDSRTKLTTIYISQADPDFCFASHTLKQLFASAKVGGTAPTVQKIQTPLPAKPQVSDRDSGQMHRRAATQRPNVLQGTALVLEDHMLEIHGLDHPLLIAAMGGSRRSRRLPAALMCSHDRRAASTLPAAERIDLIAPGLWAYHFFRFT